LNVSLGLLGGGPIYKRFVFVEDTLRNRQVERANPFAVNRRVASSNLARGANLFNGLQALLKSRFSVRSVILKSEARLPDSLFGLGLPPVEPVLPHKL
jgi:hypothetical protein